MVVVGRAPMKTLLIVYHTMTGGTQQMAEAAANAARSQPDVEVRLLRATEAQAGDVLNADGGPRCASSSSFVQ